MATELNNVAELNVAIAAAGGVAPLLSALALDIAERNKLLKPSQRAMLNMLARTVVLGCVDAKGKGDDTVAAKLGVPTMGKLGTTAFKRCMTERFGKLGKVKGEDKRRAVAIEDVTIDMVLTITSDDFSVWLSVAYDDAVVNLEKSVTLASTQMFEDKQGNYTITLTPDELEQMRVDGMKKIDGQLDTANLWAANVLPIIGHAVVLLNECNAGQLGGDTVFASMSVKLIVPMFLAGYSVRSADVARADLAARKGTKLLKQVATRMIGKGETAIAAMSNLLGLTVGAVESNEVEVELAAA